MENYYIVDCITGCIDEVEPLHDIKEARAERDAMNRASIREGHKPDFWIIVDSQGNEVS